VGSGTFFSKLASNPLFQDLDLPGSHKYQDTLGVQVGPNTGPYTGVNATLAGANGGYSAGGPGATVGATNAPNVGSNAAGLGHAPIGGWIGSINNMVNNDPGVGALSGGGAIGQIGQKVTGGGAPGNTNPVNTANPYVQAAGRAAQNAQTTNTWGG